MKDTRYKILKKKFPDYFIIVNHKSSFKTFNIDKIIYNYINPKTNKDLYIFLEKNKVNYILLDNNNKTSFKIFDNNNYQKIYYISILFYLMDEIYFNMKDI